MKSERQSSPSLPRSLSAAEAATLLGVSPSCVRRWLGSGRLPGVRVGSRFRVDPTEIAAVLAPAARRSTEGAAEDG